MINEFSDVLLDELTRIPPEREIDFAIDKLPGTQSIFVPTYRMVPSELKKIERSAKGFAG